MVGDIHGNVEKAKEFLAYKPEVEHVALGDYVDSFTESAERQLGCLQLLLDSNTVLLWGNHDLHYLREPPFRCTGYQENNHLLHELIENNKDRFVAAHVADGWLCTHAGGHGNLSQGISDVETLSVEFNKKIALFIRYPYPQREGIWAVGKSRGGFSGPGGIFWFDFKREAGIDLGIKQIFGHTEVPEPIINDHYVPKSYVALDTTNNKENMYLYDTVLNELVCLPTQKPKKSDTSPTRELVDKYKIDIVYKDQNKATYLYFNYDSEKHREIIRLIREIMRLADDEPRKEPIGEYKIGGTEINHLRIRDLPVEEQEPFRQWLMGQTRPHVPGLIGEDQDFFYQYDYERWKRH